MPYQYGTKSWVVVVELVRHFYKLLVGSMDSLIIYLVLNFIIYAMF
jgi:hypothetical protein